MLFLNKNKIVILLLLLISGVARAQSYTISGTVIDSLSGETLIGAAVMDLRTGKGALTNAQGRFSLTLKSDSVKLRVTYVGYKPVFEDILLKSNQKRTFRMQSSTELKIVVIKSERVNNVRITSTTMTILKGCRIVCEIDIGSTIAPLVAAARSGPGVANLSGTEPESPACHTTKPL